MVTDGGVVGMIMKLFGIVTDETVIGYKQLLQRVIICGGCCPIGIIPYVMSLRLKLMHGGGAPPLRIMIYFNEFNPDALLSVQDVDVHMFATSE
jgi:hypothetical protein